MPDVQRPTLDAIRDRTETACRRAAERYLVALDGDDVNAASVELHELGRILAVLDVIGQVEAARWHTHQETIDRLLA